MKINKIIIIGLSMLAVLCIFSNVSKVNASNIITIKLTKGESKIIDKDMLEELTNNQIEVYEILKAEACDNTVVKAEVLNDSQVKVEGLKEGETELVITIKTKEGTEGTKGEIPFNDIGVAVEKDENEGNFLTKILQVIVDLIKNIFGGLFS